MGNLRKYMPITHITFAIACLAIAGIPPFSGFFSKDEILAAAFHHHPVIFWTLWIVAGLTAFYMFRLFYRIFWNTTPKSPKGDLATAQSADFKSSLHEVGHHKPHEAPLTMAVPLIILAVFSVFSGLIPFADFISSDFAPFHTHIDWFVAGLSIGVALVGIGVATVLYAKSSDKPAELARQMGGLYRAALHKFYLDEVWMWFTQTVIFRYICEPIKWFDRHIIDGSMNGLAWITQKTSVSIKGLQSGQVQFYAWVFIAGSILIAILVLFL
ncbi:MAG: NADH-quinone oxidoreductase subunit L, partial [Candidatus Symbiothrix sp.]|jgi:NADH-quinone oxidoreductase subunit L|nr:NADH-quinone oxidoreductase subunit L [Candidatus Symbiothrix sp.]